MNRPKKIVSRRELAELAKQWRAGGEKIILTNGCFDLLHVGHVRYLRGAKELGGRVVVALNSDDSARALKGAGRPVTTERERAEILAALQDVDAVVIFPEKDVSAIVRELRPDIQAKGTDYTEASVPEGALVRELGGRVAIVGDPKDHSSTALVEKSGNPRKIKK
jgi:D-glycero-beta-D-manno-heptose 1-phosphate adenylyltransferase